MKLSELVAFRNQLIKLPVSLAKKAAKDELDILMNKITHPLEPSAEQLTRQYVADLEKKQNEIYQAFHNFDQVVEQVNQRIHDEIAEKEKHFFQESYKLFEEAEQCETTEHILYNRRSTDAKNPEQITADEIARSRISAYSSWHHAGMIIRPGVEDYIKLMVGCDPLYVIDRGYDLLDPAIKHFPKLYQNRLRLYTTNDWSDDPILAKVPDNQFGICLAYNVLNFRPLEIIRRYLEEIYQKLHPGGVLLMTYNDCDNEKAVMLVEQCCASYTPGYLIRDLVTNIGFELISTWNDSGPSAWLELKKPGKLTSLRGGQSIATVKNFHNLDDDVDFIKRKSYNEQEISHIHKWAQDLKINETVIQQSSPGNLRLAINDVLEQIEDEKRKEEERKYQKYLEQLAVSNGITLDDPLRQEKINKILRRIDKENLKKEKERLLQEEEERKIAQEQRAQRIAELKQRAESLDLDSAKYTEEFELINAIAEETDRRKKIELAYLRERALELQAGDTNLIKYGYSAEKLKQLIKQKEEEQK